VPGLPIAYRKLEHYLYKDQNEASDKQINKNQLNNTKQNKQTQNYLNKY